MYPLLFSLAVAAEPPTPSGADLLGRGVNLGNMLDAPVEGAWGLRLRPEYFRIIKDAGFGHVRIPIRWSVYADAQAPFALSEPFAVRVDRALDEAERVGLKVVINIHHYAGMDADPDAHRARLEAIWSQLAFRYRDRPESVSFELLNEPHDKLTAEKWNEILPELIAAARVNNPRRWLIVGPAHWNNVSKLSALELPERDRRLVVTFHYYSPFEFTHQKASWVPKSEEWAGRTWDGTDDQLAALREDFDKATEWGEKRRRPIYLGEFGAYEDAPMPSRLAWTRAVAREAEKRRFGWCYWEFGASFGVYDPKEKAWRRPLLDALTGG